MEEDRTVAAEEVAGREEVSVRVELKPGHDAAWESLEKRLGKELAHAHENLRFHVERAGTGELPRFELKAKRLVDKRKKS